MERILTWEFTGRTGIPQDAANCVGPGWHPLVLGLIDDLFGLGWNGTVAQVKEKFGGLRFYIGSGTEEIFKRIHKAEGDSYTICEQCGQPGEPRSGGWIFTLCDTCYQRREASRAERS